MSAQSCDSPPARPEWSQEFWNSEMPDDSRVTPDDSRVTPDDSSVTPGDTRVTPESPSEGPKVTAVITYTSVECIPFSFTDLKYRYRADWSAKELDSPEQKKARSGLATVSLDVSKKRKEAKFTCDQRKEWWDEGYEAHKWVETLVKVAKLLSTAEVKITVNDPQALKESSRSELHLRRHQSEDTPGGAQAAGAWESADLIKQVLKEEFPHPSEANTQVKAEVPRKRALPDSGATQVYEYITTVDTTHGSFAW